MNDGKRVLRVLLVLDLLLALGVAGFVRLQGFGWLLMMGGFLIYLLLMGIHALAHMLYITRNPDCAPRHVPIIIASHLCLIAAMLLQLDYSDAPGAYLALTMIVHNLWGWPDQAPDWIAQLSCLWNLLVFVPAGISWLLLLRISLRRAGNVAQDGQTNTSGTFVLGQEPQFASFENNSIRGSNPIHPGASRRMWGIGNSLAAALLVLFALCLLSVVLLLLPSFIEPYSAEPVSPGAAQTLVSAMPMPAGMPVPVAPKRFWSAQFSPDGKRIVTVQEDSSLRVWDAATGLQLFALSGTGDRWNAVYSPNGTKILTSIDSNYPVILDAPTGQELVRMQGHNMGVNDVLFNADGTRVLSSSGDNTARVWDAATGKQLLVLGTSFNYVRNVGYSSDGKQIVTVVENEPVRAWDAEMGKERAKLIGHEDYVQGADFSPDGKRVVTASSDKTARVWDTATGEQLLVLRGHTSGIGFAEYSPDGALIATGSDDYTARVWDAKTGKQLFLLGEHNCLISGLSFSPDGKQIVTLGEKCEPARVWEAATGKELGALSTASNRATVASYSADSKEIVTGDVDGSAQVWDSATLRGLVALRPPADSAASPTLLSAGAPAAAQALFRTAANWHLLMSDSFDDNKNNWTVESFETAMGKVSQTIAGGKYVWTLRADQPLVNREVTELRPTTDYAVSIEGRRVSGPTTCGYGVSLADDYHNFYLMAVNDDGLWRFGPTQSYTTLEPLAQGTLPIIHPTASNRILVIAHYNVYRLFVNDIFAAQVIDDALKGGSPGIGVELRSAGDVCEFEFDNFVVREAP